MTARAPLAYVRPLLALLALLASACTIEPQPIHLGAEECGHCRMVISERQFAAQALTTKGRAISFDAIECLADWVRTGEEVAAAELHSLWVSDFASPESWLDARDAVFLRSDEVRSPMGAGLTAHASLDAARGYQAELGGDVLDWDGVVELIGSQGGHAHDHHAAH